MTSAEFGRIRGKLPTSVEMAPKLAEFDPKSAEPDPNVAESRQLEETLYGCLATLSTRLWTTKALCARARAGCWHTASLRVEGPNFEQVEDWRAQVVKKRALLTRI